MLIISGIIKPRIKISSFGLNSTTLSMPDCLPFDIVMR
jgi:hypothetical protein